MIRRNSMAVLLLITLVTAIAFVSPASANGYISGTVLDNNANPINGANVTATNGTDVFYFNTTPSNPGVFVITIPTASTPKDYYVTATKHEYYGAGVQLLHVTDENTTVAQNIVMIKETYPTDKDDKAFPVSIPADYGTSATVITATIYDQDGNELVGGSVNSSITAYVNFYLKNGSLDVTTGDNGTLNNSLGGTYVNDSTIINVPIDAYGQAKVTLYSGMFPGSVEVFNNVTVNSLANEEVNATITVVFTPLQGHITGTLVSSEGALLDDANVTAYRLAWFYDNYSDTWTKSWELIKSTTSDVEGRYVLPFISLNFDVFDLPNASDMLLYEYYPETSWWDIDEQIPLAPNDPYGDELLTNYIMVVGSKAPYNDGNAKKFLMVDTTENADMVLTSGQANEILVKIVAPHQLVSDGMQNKEYAVTADLLKDDNPFAIANEDITFTIDNPAIAKFKANNNASITVKTDVDGVAITSILTSTANTGVVTVTGRHTTRDNVLLTDWDSLNVRAGGEISGFITNEYNVKIPDANVKLLGYNSSSFEYDLYPIQDLSGNNIADEPTNDNGYYTFTKVPSGQYMVSVVYGDLDGFAAPVNVTTGTTTANVVIEGAVLPGNLPPVIASFYPTSVTQYDTVQLIITASDPEGQPLFYAWDLNNDGVYEIGRSTSNTRYHTFSTSGLNTIRVHVDDGVVSTEQSIDIDVVPVTNIPAVNENDPVIASVSPVVVETGSLTTLTLSASDADGDTLYYAFDIDGNGYFESGRSTGNTIATTIDSTRVINVRVDDGIRVTTMAVTIAASPTGANALPTFTAATPTTATVNVPTTFTLSATDSDNFPNPISFMVDADNDGTYDKVFVGNPDATRSAINQVSITFTTTGTHVVPLRVDDGVGTTTSSFTVVVS